MPDLTEFAIVTTAEAEVTHATPDTIQEQEK